MPYAKRGLKGFTLIELLVVIAIIAILMSVLLPSLSRSRDLARSIACMANLKNIHVALQVYVDSAGDRYPYQVAIPPGYTTPGHTYGYMMRTWPSYFFDSLKNTAGCYCPSDPAKSGRPSVPSANPGYNVGYAYRYAMSYAAEVQLLRCLKSSDFRAPSRQVIFDEIADWHKRKIPLWIAYPGYAGPIYLNALYVDGHVAQWAMSYWSTGFSNYDSNWFTVYNGTSDGSWNPRSGND